MSKRSWDRMTPGDQKVVTEAALEANTDKAKIWTASPEPEASRRTIYAFVKRGLVLSAHDVSEGGLAVALAEMAFSGKAGIRADLAVVPTIDDTPAAEHLFGETPGRILFEVAPKDAMLAEQQGFTIIGETTDDGWLTITNESQKLVHAKVSDLKPIWKGGLSEYY